jgi:2,3-bisphosphoglycerate-dependent phosphoglycerate mutase
MKTTLLIARHGNTFGPNDPVTRVGARTDLPLVEAGLEQGLKLGVYLKQRHLIPAKIFTSRLKRTQQTAEKILEGLGQSVPAEQQALFDEIDYGPDENMTEDKVIARIGEQAIRDWDEKCIAPPGWIVDPLALTIGWQEFATKVLTEHKGETVLVVTSNGIARFAPVLTGDMSKFNETHRPKIATGALCHFETEDGPNWDVVGWNIRP